MPQLSDAAASAAQRLRERWPFHEHRYGLERDLDRICEDGEAGRRWVEDTLATASPELLAALANLLLWNCADERCLTATPTGLGSLPLWLQAAVRRVVAECEGKRAAAGLSFYLMQSFAAEDIAVLQGTCRHVISAGREEDLPSFRLAVQVYVADDRLGLGQEDPTTIWLQEIARDPFDAHGETAFDAITRSRLDVSADLLSEALVSSDEHRRLRALHNLSTATLLLRVTGTPAEIESQVCSAIETGVLGSGQLMERRETKSALLRVAIGLGDRNLGAALLRRWQATVPAAEAEFLGQIADRLLTEESIDEVRAATRRPPW